MSEPYPASAPLTPPAANMAPPVPPMPPLSPTEAASVGYSDENRFGLPQETNLLVERNATKSLEPGWFVADRVGVKAPGGEVIDAVVVRRVTGRSEGTIHFSEKVLRTDQLLAWQPKPEDDAEAGDTIPRVPQGSDAEEETVKRVPQHHAGGLAVAGALAHQSKAMPRASAPAAPEKSEADRNPRWEKIFAPLLDESDLAALPEAGYDWMLEKDEEIYQQKKAEYGRITDERNELKKRIPEVDDNTRRNSAEQLAVARSRDRRVDAIIRSYADKHGVSDPLETVDLIRRNADLRYDLGSYFMQKIEAKLPAMPDRVRRNTEKSLNLPIYDHLKGLKPHSREYAALLSLAMIDGTFRGRDAEEMYYDSQGRVIGGLHRDAAYQLLTTNEDKI